MKTISERTVELTPQVLATVLARSRKGIEANSGAFSDDEWAEFLLTDGSTLNALAELGASLGALSVAVDEWQAAVEERLLKLENPMLFIQSPAAVTNPPPAT